MRIQWNGCLQAQRHPQLCKLLAVKLKLLLAVAVSCVALVVVACGSGSTSGGGSGDKGTTSATKGTISATDAEAIFREKCIDLTVERLPLQIYSNDDAVQACFAVMMSLQEKGKFDGLTKKQANKLAAKNWEDVAGAAELFRTQAQ